MIRKVILPLSYNPKKGQLLMCDFSKGFESPEMTKKRPVVVIGVNEKQKLVTVVPLSTKAPHPMQDYHYLVPKRSTPQTPLFADKESWLKGNMLYTVGWKRLDRIRLGKDRNDKRTYYDQKLGPETVQQIYICVIKGLGINKELLSSICCVL